MTKKQYGVFVFVLFGLMLTGCQTGFLAPPVETPVVQMLGLEIQNVRLDYASLLFELDVNNPNPFPLSLLQLKYTLANQGNIFRTATALKDVIVPANRRQALWLSDEVIYDRLLRGLNSQPGKKIPYDARLWVSMETTGRPIDIQLRHQGHLSLPQAVKVEVDGRVYDSLDVVFVGTPADVVSEMLDVARVGRGDLVYDLGCGDGRIVVAAAKKYGCRAVGYDIDPARVTEARQKAQQNGVSNLVRIEQKDIFTLDLSQADVIAIYLTPEMNSRLIPQLKKLKPGARVVAHSFTIPGIEPDASITMISSEDHKKHSIFLWTLPFK